MDTSLTFKGRLKLVNFLTFDRFHSLFFFKKSHWHPSDYNKGISHIYLPLCYMLLCYKVELADQLVENYPKFINRSLLAKIKDAFFNNSPLGSKYATPSQSCKTRQRRDLMQ